MIIKYLGYKRGIPQKAKLYTPLPLWGGAWGWGFLLFLLFSCHPDTVLHTYQSIDSQTWGMRDTLSFSLDSIPTDGQYQLSVCLRLTNHYPYRSLWMVAETQGVRDTIEVRLLDNDGQPLGHGTNFLQIEQTSAPRHFHKGEAVPIRLYHIMHREELLGIADIGLRIDRVPSAK